MSTRPGVLPSLLVASLAALASLGWFVPSSAPARVDPIDTADEALAAVLALRPDLADARPIWGAPDMSGPIVGGPVGDAGTTVIAHATDGVIVLVFRTGVGDCPSGCIEVRAEVFTVTPDGLVREGCPAPSTGVVTAPSMAGASSSPPTDTVDASRPTTDPPDVVDPCDAGSTFGALTDARSGDT
jgi:hypothetical protein